MININLLSERKLAKGKAAAPSSTPTLKLEGMGSGSNLLLIGILLVGAAAAAGWWWLLQKETVQWQERIVQADQELKRLEDVLKKTEEFEKQKALLTRKIGLITDLKKQQAVPVHILDQISRTLPDFLWLDSLNANGGHITLSGKATTYTAVSNFYAGLNESGYFSDVALGRTFEVPEGVAFSLTCAFADRSKVPATPGQQPKS